MVKTDVIVSVENISKEYTAHDKVLTRNKNLQRSFALKDISFTVNRGEVWGVIGRNGSGKSTLLKILAGVLTPTAGKASVWGKVMPILDIGGGLHPELSGIENGYMLGHLLGFNTHVIKHKIKDLADFSELGAYLNQPVKVYSKGMYLRLAFSVALMYDVDILLLDEVLAVGDAVFMAKCNEKIEEMIKKGTAIILASHNNSDIIKICNKCIWLDNGELVDAGEANQVISNYILSVKGEVSQNQDSATNLIDEHVWTDADAPSNTVVRLNSVTIANSGVYKGNAQLDYNKSIDISIAYSKISFEHSLSFIISFFDFSGNPVFIASNAVNLPGFSIVNSPGERGDYRCICTIPAHIFNIGRYKVQLTVLQDNSEVSLLVRNVLSFEVTTQHEEQRDILNKMPMNVAALFKWSVHQGF